MKKNSTLTGKQIHWCNVIQFFGWVIFALGVFLLSAWAMANDPTWTSIAFVAMLWTGMCAGVLAWWVRESYQVGH